VPIKNYRDLIAWQKSMDLAETTYRLTQDFPAEERYRLTTQMRRAAVSIPSNIADGQGRGTDPEFHHRLSIAHGSVRELETQALVARRLGFLNESGLEALMNGASEVGKLITGLSKSLA
jgi:four helix bundle protein